MVFTLTLMNTSENVHLVWTGEEFLNVDFLSSLLELLRTDSVVKTYHSFLWSVRIFVSEKGVWEEIEEKTLKKLKKNRKIDKMKKLKEMKKSNKIKKKIIMHKYPCHHVNKCEKFSRISYRFSLCCPLTTKQFKFF